MQCSENAFAPKAIFGRSIHFVYSADTKPSCLKLNDRDESMSRCMQHVLKRDRMGWHTWVLEGIMTCNCVFRNVFPFPVLQNNR
jgi:hypothetical protein